MIMDALHDYLISRPQLSEFYDAITQIGYIYLIGGILREYKDHGDIINLRDIDMIVDVHDEHKWEKLLQTHKMKTNRFGGQKIQIDDIEVDVWRIENTWAYRERKVIAADRVKALPQTVFLNIDGIVYDCKSDMWLTEEYDNAMRTQVLDVVLEDNPQIELNLLRAMVLRKRYHMVYSQRLKETFRKKLLPEGNCDELEKILQKEQIKRYGEEILTETEIKNELCTILN